MVFLVACSTSLYEPAGLGLPPHINPEIRDAAILRGIDKAGWELDKQLAGRFYVSYQDEDENAVVQIRQENKVLHFKFYAIEGEKNPEKFRELHSFEYNRKMLELEEQIALEVAKVI